MKVKNYIWGAFVALATLAGCDEVDEQDRFISMGDVEVKRNVLLEDFTGQDCSNCPTAHEVVASLKEQYGDAVVAVAVHATSVFGIPEGDPRGGLMLPDGNVYLSQWANPDNVSLPTGVVNRRGGLCDYSKWSTTVRDALAEDTQVQLSIEADSVVGKDSIAIRVHLEPGVTVNAKLQLWVTENGIVARQRNGHQTDRKYVHNHVYRGAVNGVGGEEVSLQKDMFLDFERGVQIKSEWNVENLSVVGFVYTEADGVLQAVECEVK